MILDEPVAVALILVVLTTRIRTETIGPRIWASHVVVLPWLGVGVVPPHTGKSLFGQSGLACLIRTLYSGVLRIQLCRSRPRCHDLDVLEKSSFFHVKPIFLIVNFDTQLNI